MNDYVIINNSLKFPAKFAITPKEQEAGLMNCLEPIIMAFPSQKSIKSFWMKNTPMPLDLIFACDGVIVDCLPGVPFSLERICPKNESDLVVEFPKGLLNYFPINIGDPIELQYSIKTMAKKYDLNLQKRGAL